MYIHLLWFVYFKRTFHSGSKLKIGFLLVAMSNNLQHILIATYCSIVDWDGGVWWRWLGVRWQFTLSFPCDTELLPSHRPLDSLNFTSGLTSSPSGKELKRYGSYHLLWPGCRASELPCTWFPELPCTALDFCLSEKWLFQLRCFVCSFLVFMDSQLWKTYSSFTCPGCSYWA